MSLALVHARALDGIEAPPVTVEVHLGNGLPQFHLVGLADTEVREARDRVRAAIQSAQFEFPQRRITVNLAPADLPKEGGRFDLAIAIGILAASGQVAERLLPRLELCGEPIRVTEIDPGMAVTEFSMVRLRDQHKADAVYKGVEPLRAEDVAECIRWAVAAPDHVNIDQIIVKCRDQASHNGTKVHRRA